MNEVDPRNLRAASRARNLAAAYYLFNPRVTLVDVGWYIDQQTGQAIEGDLRVRIHVRQQPRGAAFEALSEAQPQLIIHKEVIPFDVDLVEASYPLAWYWYPPEVLQRLRVFNPLVAGISISNEWSYGSGTLGGLVKERGTDEEMILSNWHVLAGSDHVRRGLRIYQPGYAEGGRIQHTMALLERHAMNQGFDAAVAKLTGARPWNNEQMEIGPVSGVAAPALGMRVIKSGRGSGITHGIIDGVEGEYPIYYGGFPRMIRCVYRIVPAGGANTVSSGGDSGSWWLKEDSKQAVALHFAGYDQPEAALAMGMPQTLETLNVYIP